MSSNPSAAFVSPRSQVRFLGSIVFIDVTLMIDFRHFLVIPTTIIKLPRITTNLVERDLLRHWYNREVVVLPHPTACTTPSHAHCYAHFLLAVFGHSLVFGRHLLSLLSTASPGRFISHSKYFVRLHQFTLLLLYLLRSHHIN